jgi:hypothetical protein
MARRAAGKIMAARKPKASPLFTLAERQIIALYDAGVLSPAVLHHVLAAYADSGIDWSEAGKLRTVDDHSMQEAVVLVMMPGRVSRSAQKDFIAVVEHLGGDGAAASIKDEEPTEDDESLLTQLGGGKRRGNASANVRSNTARKPVAFNPLVGAKAVPRR